MTRTQKAQLIRWLRSVRDLWRAIARSPGNVYSAYTYHKIADAFHEAAQQLHYEITKPDGPMSETAALY